MKSLVICPSHILRISAVRVNETDTFADEDGANDEYFDFEDISGLYLADTFYASLLAYSCLAVLQTSTPDPPPENKMG